MQSCPIKQNVGGVERLGCLFLGGLILLSGLASRRAFRTAVGGLLAYRGLSGNCKCYEMLGIDTRSETEKQG